MQQRLQAFMDDPLNADATERLNMKAQYEYATQQRQLAESGDYIASLQGTLGVDPMSPLPNDPVMLDRLASV